MKKDILTTEDTEKYIENKIITTYFYDFLFALFLCKVKVNYL